jgi:hypothetical protein
MFRLYFLQATEKISPQQKSLNQALKRVQQRERGYLNI